MKIRGGELEEALRVAKRERSRHGEVQSLLFSTSCLDLCISSTPVCIHDSHSTLGLLIVFRNDALNELKPEAARNEMEDNTGLARVTAALLPFAAAIPHNAAGEAPRRAHTALPRAHPGPLPQRPRGRLRQFLRGPDSSAQQASGNTGTEDNEPPHDSILISQYDPTICTFPLVLRLLPVLFYPALSISSSNPLPSSPQSSLSKHANDIFTELLVETTNISKRVKAAGDRASRLKTTLDAMDYKKAGQ